MKVKSIAECSPWSILQYFWTALNDNWSSFLSGRLRQILLYNQQSIFKYAYKCLCQCVVKVYYPNVNCGYFDMLGPIISENDPPFLLHRSLRPTNLEKNLKPCGFRQINRLAIQPKCTFLGQTVLTNRCVVVCWSSWTSSMVLIVESTSDFVISFWVNRFINKISPS